MVDLEAAVGAAPDTDTVACSDSVADPPPIPSRSRTEIPYW
jgi:hypothetical protein